MSYFNFLPQELVDTVFIYVDIFIIMDNINLFRLTLINKYNCINKILWEYPMINNNFIQLETWFSQSSLYLITVFHILNEYKNIYHTIFIVMIEGNQVITFAEQSYDKIYSYDLIKLKSFTNPERLCIFDDQMAKADKFSM